MAEVTGAQSEEAKTMQAKLGGQADGQAGAKAMRTVTA
jgi:hypothetical protein